MLVATVTALLSVVVAYILYAYKKIHRYYDTRGIRYMPGVPLFGNILRTTFYKRHYVEDLEAVYKAFPSEKYVGFIDGTVRAILVRDPELIRLITVKHFDHFVDRKIFFDGDIEPMFGGSLLSLKGEKWRDMRSTLSPAFTSSKMRLMMPFVVKITSNIINHLKDRQNEDINIDDLMRCYTNDVIASTAFGVEIDSVKNKENEFYKAGSKLTDFTIFQNIFIILTTMFPTLCRRLGIKIFPEHVTGFFTNVVKETTEYRDKNNIIRPDMLQLLNEASKEWSINELVGQVFIFFIAGFESSASVLSFTIHELALNKHVQEKLYQEIKDYHDKNGELKYADISSLKYLDCVINETMRKWSPAIFMDRMCTKSYELPPPREGAQPVKINPGDLVFSMVNAIQMDPKYFPEPEVFDPDRFSDDDKIEPFTFMPFGMGPRGCIGMRFAVLEVKLFLYYLFLNFKILKCPRTEEPIRLKAHAINIKAVNGTWVRLQLRS